jgi:hypothetical protein
MAASLVRSSEKAGWTTNGANAMRKIRTIFMVLLQEYVKIG